MIKVLKHSHMFCEKLLHQVGQNETLTSIASDYNTTVASIKSANPELNEIRAGACIFITDINQRFYVVKPTDTLESIAQKHRTSKEKIKQKNNLKEIFIGQLLSID